MNRLRFAGLMLFALLFVAPMASAQDSWPGCPGAAYDPMVHGYVPACFNQPADNAAALKPAGLAAPEMTAKQNQDGPVCAPGYYYYVVGPGDQGDCFPESDLERERNSHRGSLKARGAGGSGPSRHPGAGLVGLPVGV